MCDTIAATGRATAEGGVLFGKNSDREYNEAQYLQWVPPAAYGSGARVRLTYVEIDQAPRTHGVLLSKPHWIWGAEIGANEHGLVIGNEAIFSRIEASSTPGVIGMDYLRLALERAQGVDEAIHVMTTLLARHGQSGNCGYKRELTYHNSFILADPHGAKILETVEREWVVRAFDGYSAISNAMTIEDDFRLSSPTLVSTARERGFYADDAPFSFRQVFEDPQRRASGCHRRARAIELLGASSGTLGARDFFRILRDHVEGEPLPGRSSGPRICAHARDNPIGQTTASWVADIKAGAVVHWVTGTAAPCTGVFKPVLLGVDLPEHGPPPAAAEDGVSLWWRHERFRTLLESCAPELQAQFEEQRNELETGFLQRVAAASAAPKRDDLHPVVNECWMQALEFEARWMAHLAP
jgi:dipeptidase